MSDPPRLRDLPDGGFAHDLLRSAAPTPAMDVYSAGLVLIEMLTGRLPFAGDDPMALVRAHVTTAPPRLWARIGTGLSGNSAFRPGPEVTAHCRPRRCEWIGASGAINGRMR